MDPARIGDDKVSFAPEAIRAEIGNRRYAALAPKVVAGVTGRSMPVGSLGGTTIGIDVSPLGWARLFGQSAKALRDRVVPLGNMLPADVVE